MKNIGIPVKLSETPGRIRSRAPKLGEHTVEVLAQAGYSEDEAAALIEAGIAQKPPHLSA